MDRLKTIILTSQFVTLPNRLHILYIYNVYVCMNWTVSWLLFSLPPVSSQTHRTMASVANDESAHQKVGGHLHKRPNSTRLREKSTIPVLILLDLMSAFAVCLVWKMHLQAISNNELISSSKQCSSIKIGATLSFVALKRNTGRQRVSS